MKIKKNAGFKIILLLLPASLLLNECSDSPAEKIQKSPPPITPTVLKFVNPAKKNPFYKLTIPGELVPYEQVTIYPKIKGFVKKLYVDRGSIVKQGQLLAVLEAPEIDERNQSSQSDQRKYFEDYVYSRRAFDRLKKASLKNGAVAAIELDKAQSKLRADSAAYSAAKSTAGASAQLSQYLRIIAPFNGVIVARDISVGALVGENMTEPLFVMAENQRLRLTVAVPEKHAASINKSTVASFIVSDRPGLVFHTKISRDGKLLQQTTRSVTVEFDVMNKDLSLSGGEYAEVTLMLHRPDSTLWLPASSIVHAQSGIFILKVENQAVHRIQVLEGIRKDSLQEVFGQLSVKDSILKVGTEEIADGSKVAIKK